MNINIFSRRSVRKTQKKRLGASVVEFAIVAPVLMLLLVAVMEFGRMYWVRDSVQYAAEQTVTRVSNSQTS